MLVYVKLLKIVVLVALLVVMHHPLIAMVVIVILPGSADVMVDGVIGDPVVVMVTKQGSAQVMDLYIKSDSVLLNLHHAIPEELPVEPALLPADPEYKVAQMAAIPGTKHVIMGLVVPL